MKDCIFCKIVRKEIPADVVLEEEDILVFRDIKPKTPVHLLIIPKKHIPSVNEVSEEDESLLGRMFLTAKKVAKKEGVADSGYKLSVHVGENAGQEVFHLHIHLMGWKHVNE